MSPLEHLISTNSKTPARGLSSMFSSILRGDHQLISCEPSRDTYLACALLLRGDVQVSDVQHNMSKLRSKMRFIHWNSDGFKVGLCSMPRQVHRTPCLSCKQLLCSWYIQTTSGSFLNIVLVHIYITTLNTEKEEWRSRWTSRNLIEKDLS